LPKPKEEVVTRNGGSTRILVSIREWAGKRQVGNETVVRSGYQKGKEKGDKLYEKETESKRISVTGGLKRTLIVAHHVENGES